MPGLIMPDQRFSDDDGAAEPRLGAALTAYADGRGSEHAVLTALAEARLLVPVVAAATRTESASGPPGRTLRREKTSEMALPTLAGRDGRRAMIAFTCVSALVRWRQDARPRPAPSDAVCQAAIAEGVAAVVLDVAGPVPVVLEGARLSALASGVTPPLPAEDPDVRAAVETAVAGDPRIAGACLLAQGRDTDLRVRLVLAGAGGELEHQAAARRAATAIMGVLGNRFRRGIEVAVGPAPPGGCG